MNLLQGGGGEDERWEGVVCLARGYLGGGGRPGKNPHQFDSIGICD